MNEFSKEELDLLLTEREEASVTGTQAKEDIEMLFRLLQTTYGGYYHFGGDEVFLPVRDNLIASVEKKDLTGVDSNLVKQTIGPDGELTFCFAALSHDGSDLPAAVEISGKQKKLK